MSCRPHNHNMLQVVLQANHTGTKLTEAALGGFNERIDVSDTYPTGTPEVFARGGLGLFSTIGDYANFAQMLLNGGELHGQFVEVRYRVVACLGGRST